MTVKNNMQESHKKLAARKLERKIMSFKSDQSMSELEKEEISALEAYDPSLVDELLLKRKWRNVQRDPSRSLKD